MALKQFVQSFAYALQGVKIAWMRGVNFRIQICIAVLVLAAAVRMQASFIEESALVLAVGAVLGAEIFNTALEELCDKFSPTHDPHIARIKDLSAAAVLVISVAALVVGILVFGHHV